MTIYMEIRGYIWKIGKVLKSNQIWISWAYNSLQIYTFALVIAFKIECVNFYVHQNAQQKRLIYNSVSSLAPSLVLLQNWYRQHNIERLNPSLYSISVKGRQFIQYFIYCSYNNIEHNTIWILWMCYSLCAYS